MKIVHFSDTHLGYSAYRATDQETGLNQREVDVYNVFNEIINYILDTKPDLVIHAGDLFDNVRPSNRAIYEAFRQFARLSAANISTVVIAGNHSTPRHKLTGSIFKLLEYLPNIYSIFDGEYKAVEVGDAKIHSIPHCYSDEMLRTNFEKLQIDKNFKYNILVTHATVSGINGYAGGEFKQQTIPLSVLSPDFDYIALGHFHRFLKVAENAYYSGSPERFSFNEARDKKGFLEVNLGSLHVKHISTKARDMIDLPPIDCAKLDAAQVIHKIETELPRPLTDKIVRVILQDISPHVYTSLDFTKIKDILSEAVDYEIEYGRKSSSPYSIGSSSIGNLGEEFKGFLQKQELDKKLLPKLRRLGLSYLEKAMEQEEEE